MRTKRIEQRESLQGAPGSRRGRPRRSTKLFVTPNWAIDAIIPHVQLAGRIVDPAAGNGAIVQRLLAAGVAPQRIEAFEVVRGRAKHVRELGVRCHVGVALVTVPSLRPDLVLGNPPFSRALEFARVALEWTAGMGTVALLMRLGLLAGQARAEFWAHNPADVFVLAARPSFTQDRRVYFGDFAWYLFGPGRGGRWSRLEVPRQGSVPRTAGGHEG